MASPASLRSLALLLICACISCTQQGYVYKNGEWVNDAVSPTPMPTLTKCKHKHGCDLTSTYCHPLNNITVHCLCRYGYTPKSHSKTSCMWVGKPTSGPTPEPAWTSFPTPSGMGKEISKSTPTKCPTAKPTVVPGTWQIYRHRGHTYEWDLVKSFIYRKKIMDVSAPKQVANACAITCHKLKKCKAWEVVPNTDEESQNLLRATATKLSQAARKAKKAVARRTFRDHFPDAAPSPARRLLRATAIKLSQAARKAKAGGNSTARFGFPSPGCYMFGDGIKEPTKLASPHFWTASKWREKAHGWDDAHAGT
jgi:hypothetical protein